MNASHPVIWCLLGVVVLTSNALAECTAFPPEESSGRGSSDSTSVREWRAAGCAEIAAKQQRIFKRRYDECVEAIESPEITSEPIYPAGESPGDLRYSAARRECAESARSESTLLSGSQGN